MNKILYIYVSKIIRMTIKYNLSILCKLLWTLMYIIMNTLHGFVTGCKRD